MALNGLYCADVPLSNYSLTAIISKQQIGSVERAISHITQQHLLRLTFVC